MQHNPPTPRYGRAQVKLAYLIRDGQLLGVRPVPGHSDRFEIATWTRPPSGHGYGYYSCFRIFFEDGAVVAALLFAFHDGTEKSPGFKSFDAAALYAFGLGFEVVT